PPGTQITVRLLGGPGAVQVEVSDTGQGIPAELREGLFTHASVLRRTANESGGLGLIIVQRMLQLHGSEIKVIEGEKPGAVFRFALTTAA
ncbi:MAG TPA: ATP-binding protein, partial [Candidimonas sp.]|nr:ATP-binding protein [Candidimonas sp.]